MTNKKQNGVNPVAAAVAGAVVGAGVAIAGAIALKDEKNRKKVQEVLKDTKDQASKHMKTMQGEAKEKTAEIKEKVTKVIEK